jgi:alpha-L-rhamnosidase
LMGVSVKYNYDVANLFRKQIRDMQYSQTEDGLVPEIAPEYVKFDWGNGMFRDSPEWGSSSIIVPWYLYQWYGDKDILEESYGLMTKYESYLRSKTKDHILYQGLGDWYDLGPKAPGVSQLTPAGVTGTAMYYYDLNILWQVAELLGIGVRRTCICCKKSFQ